MAERNTVKPRTCRKCSEVFEMTAKGIADHAMTCSASNPQEVK